MYKKKILIVILCILMLLTLTVVSNAEATGTITGETVKLREGPSLEADLVTLLSVDNKVEVISKNGDWYQVKYKDYEGYVYADYISVNGEVEEEQTNTNSEDNVLQTNDINNENIDNDSENIISNIISNEDTNSIESNSTIQENNIVGTTQILVDRTELKILPLINAENIIVLEKDTSVIVNDEKNGWAFISNSNVSGWVRVEKLALKQDVDTTDKVDNKESTEETTEVIDTEEDKQTTTTGYISAGTVNVRETASTSGKIVTTLSRNTEVTVENVENGWAKISTSTGVKGYVSNQYISNERIQETNRSSSERKTSELNTKNDEVVVENTSSKNTQVVDFAKSLLGKKYSYGGVGPNSFDCSGFTKYVYNNFGISLSHSASAQANVGRTILKSDLQPGDMVFFTQGGSSIGHVGIYVGNNSFIHAANPQKGVVITSLSDGYYTRNYVTSKRIL